MGAKSSGPATAASSNSAVSWTPYVAPSKCKTRWPSAMPACPGSSNRLSDRHSSGRRGRGERRRSHGRRWAARGVKRIARPTRGRQASPEIDESLFALQHRLQSLATTDRPGVESGPSARERPLVPALSGRQSLETRQSLKDTMKSLLADGADRHLRAAKIAWIVVVT